MTNNIIETSTIGFTNKSARDFFSLLKKSNCNHLIDVRLNNSSQLAGFTKNEDLKFFLKEIIGWKYSHIPDFAPNKEILDNYKKFGGSWEVYRLEFMNLMESRNIENTFKKNDLDKVCLLCSEHLPHNCHRSLILEYLNLKWNTNILITHLF
ncbi:MAG: DUF488 domain-containing protein [Cytophagales bacterium]|nr:DUF488 domain-containing protein [Cytophagales bacterium]